MSSNLSAELLEFRISCVGRHRKDRTQAGWRAKLYAVFFEVADLNQEFEKRWAQLQTNAGKSYKVLAQMRVQRFRTTFRLVHERTGSARKMV
jgi:hypothetical protein